MLGLWGWYNTRYSTVHGLEELKRLKPVKRTEYIIEGFPFKPYGTNLTIYLRTGTI